MIAMRFVIILLDSILHNTQLSTSFGELLDFIDKIDLYSQPTPIFFDISITYTYDKNITISSINNKYKNGI